MARLQRGEASHRRTGGGGVSAGRKWCVAFVPTSRARGETSSPRAALLNGALGRGPLGLGKTEAWAVR
jgi:hypothetical protein